MGKLRRSNTEKVIGGVCGGLAEYLRIDPLLVRVLFVVLAATTGLGLAAYLAMWVLVPAASAEGLSNEEVVRHNVEEIGARARELGAEARQAFEGAHGDSSSHLLAGGFGLVIVGALILLANLGLLRWFRLRTLWPLLLIAAGAAMLLAKVRDWR